ncbi:hypothetical protein ATL41_2356 [Flavimobilis soli]|uniref:Glycosyltransferase 2-like domain-containing protein n=1 Tax=Flavimobilis soli TaxID=442709 RepID=A0A2A9EH63_9MICO|nr:glycosyltransferase [Flavimobilis soli]PFG37589.1 hypothetical protein ATL41_2356 [Flavimobilis soli]
MSPGTLGGEQPVVDVVVAVHSELRPVERAVASAVTGTVPVRVTVVCHDLEPGLVEERVRDVRRSLDGGPHSMWLVCFSDGVRSPAGPFNHGLDCAQAPFVALLGSDDVLEPGAIDSWVRLQRQTGADVVVPRLRHGALGAPGAPPGPGPAVPTPPARPLRSRRLDLVRDRLAYRSAPLGLLRRETVERLGLTMASGMTVGEDTWFGLGLWSGADVVAYDRRGPAYVIGADAADRVTFATKPVAVELACVHDAVARPALADLPRAARRAVATKLTRINLFAAVHNRSEDHTWTARDLASLRAGAVALAGFAPGYERVLSVAERDLLDALRAPAPAGEGDVARRGAELVRLSARRRRHGTLATLRTRDLRALLAREAPLRLMTASVLTTRL